MRDIFRVNYAAGRALMCIISTGDWALIERTHPDLFCFAERVMRLPTVMLLAKNFC